MVASSENETLIPATGNMWQTRSNFNLVQKIHAFQEARKSNKEFSART